MTTSREPLADMPALPPLPPFDSKATRRAVLRGLLRTAFLTLLLLLVGSLVLQQLSFVLQTRGDRRQHMQDVVGQGLGVANPDYDFNGFGCCNTDLNGMSLVINGAPRGPGDVASTPTLFLKQNLWGRLRGPVFLQQTPLDQQLRRISGQGPARGEAAAARNLLTRLGPPLRLSAVVEFARPMSPAEFQRFSANKNLPPFALPILLGPGRTASEERSGRPSNGTPLSWPDPDPRAFVEWVGGLRDSDEDNLADIGLPDLDVLRAAADDPRIYGYVVDSATGPELDRLLDDSRVGTVRVADADYRFP